MRLPRTYLAYYALPAFSLAMLGLPLYIYLPTFYTQSFQLSTLEVGIVLFLARTLDLVIDPWLGSLSDRYRQRKPLMFLGTFLLLAGFYFIAFPLYPSSLWLLIFSLLAYTGWSLITIPYYALSAELNPEYHANTQLASSRELFSLLGFVIALVAPYLLGISEDAEETIELMFILVLSTLPFLLIFFSRKIPEPEHRLNTSFSLLSGFSRLFGRIPQARLLFYAFFINSLANALPATLFLFFVSMVLQTPASTGVLLLIYFLSGIVALPAWLHLSKTKGKKQTWILSMLLASAAFSTVPSLGEGDHIAFMVICFVSGLSLGADMVLPSSIQADISQQLQREEQNLAGLLFGLWSMLTKFSLALAVGISFVLLGWFGFDTDTPSPESLQLLHYLYAIGPVWLKLLAIYFINQYKENPLSV